MHQKCTTSINKTRKVWEGTAPLQTSLQWGEGWNLEGNPLPRLHSLATFGRSTGPHILKRGYAYASSRCVVCATARRAGNEYKEKLTTRRIRQTKVVRHRPGILRADALQVVRRACVDGGVRNGAAIHSEILSAHGCQHRTTADSAAHYTASGLSHCDPHRPCASVTRSETHPFRKSVK